MLSLLESIFGCWHSWTRWHDIRIDWADKGYSTTGQKRICRKCGKDEIKY